jgi:hypothetical protein
LLHAIRKQVFIKPVRIANRMPVKTMAFESNTPLMADLAGGTFIARRFCNRNSRPLSFFKRPALKNNHQTRNNIV